MLTSMLLDCIASFTHLTLLCQDSTKRSIVSNKRSASSAIHVMYRNMFKFLASAALQRTGRGKELETPTQVKSREIAASICCTATPSADVYCNMTGATISEHGRACDDRVSGSPPWCLVGLSRVFTRFHHQLVSVAMITTPLSLSHQETDCHSPPSKVSHPSYMSISSF